MILWGKIKHLTIEKRGGVNFFDILSFTGVRVIYRVLGQLATCMAVNLISKYEF